jgi:hypothetical protein
VAPLPSDAVAPPQAAAVDFGPPGPIVVKGYPAPLQGVGMADHITHGGFTKDGTELGYCEPAGGRGGTVCAFEGKDGKTADTFDFGGPDDTTGKETRRVTAWLHEHGIVAVTKPPPLTGSWAFARDITLQVRSLGGELDVGGSLSGEAPVFPIVVRPPRNGGLEYQFTEADLIALSPDGSELGVIAHSFCMEYCDPKETARLPVTRFAARIYNDTAFVHHKQGDFAKSADLFAKATAANPDDSLFAYNLACAYARLSDPRADAALCKYIALGGD